MSGKDDVGKETPRQYEAGYNRPEGVYYKFQAELDRERARIMRLNDPFEILDGLLCLINDLSGRITGKMPELEEEVDGIIGDLDSDKFSTKTRITMDGNKISVYHDSIPMEATPETLHLVLPLAEREKMGVSIRKLWYKLGKLESIAFREKILDPDGWSLDYSEESRLSKDLEDPYK